MEGWTVFEGVRLLLLWGGSLPPKSSWGGKGGCCCARGGGGADSSLGILYFGEEKISQPCWVLLRDNDVSEKRCGAFLGAGLDGAWAAGRARTTVSRAVGARRCRSSPARWGLTSRPIRALRSRCRRSAPSLLLPGHVAAGGAQEWRHCAAPRRRSHAGLGRWRRRGPVAAGWARGGGCWGGRAEDRAGSAGRRWALGTVAGRRERTAGRVLRPVWCGPARPGAGDAVRGSAGAGTKSARCSGPGWRVPSGAGPSRRFPPLPSLLTSCPVTPGAAEVPALLRWSDRPGSGPALRAVRPALKAPEGKWNRALALLHASVSPVKLSKGQPRPV